MKHKELMQIMQRESGLSAEKVQDMTDKAIALISEILSKEDSLSIQKFGAFEVKKKEERLSVNPMTGKRYMVPPKLTAVFRPGTTLKEKLKNYDSHE